MGLETVALIATAAAAVGGAANTAYTAKRAGDTADKQQAETARQRKELEDKMAAEQSTDAARVARERQRQLSSKMQGRRSTILTGPLGIPDETPLGGGSRASGATY